MTEPIAHLEHVTPDANSEPPPLLRRLLPPVCAFVVTRLVLSYVAVLSGHEPLSHTTWARWDSEHYVGIALSGYELFLCEAGDRWTADDWCGNTGWFPGYPALISVFARRGVSPAFSAIAIPAAAYLAMLYLLWNYFLGAEWSWRNLLVLAAAALFPGNIYYHAAFPMSLLALLVLGCIAAGARGRLGIAGLCGGLAALTHTTGILLAPAVGLWLLLRNWQNGWCIAVQRAATVSLLIVLGLVAVFVTHEIQVGTWDASLKVQAKYGHTPQNPLGTLTETVLQPFRQKQSLLASTPAIQTAVVAVFVSCLVVAGVRDLLRQPSSDRYRVELLCLVVVVIFWLFPLVMGSGVSLYRAESILVPAVVIARRLPIWLLLPFVISFGALTLPMAVLFFRAVLI
ncbi:MAG: hypothetical protein O3C40_22415 [Planctomycetota bacterium]|nr:hypothetical protein [Planctomycetota bacterium]